MNKKGMTLVEIIISIALISIVLIFLFSLLVNVRDINSSSEVNTTYLINKALILKNIEEDLDKVDSITLDTCEINYFYTTYPESSDIATSSYFIKEDGENEETIKTRWANECISFNFGENSKAYLGIYYYKNKDSYVISYIHDSIKATRLLPDFAKFNVTDGKINFDIKYSNSNSNNNCVLTGNNPNCETTTNNDKIFHKIEIPIIGDDEKDYSILISYYGKLNIE